VFTLPIVLFLVERRRSRREAAHQAALAAVRPELEPS
jgi:hypothetical protein